MNIIGVDIDGVLAQFNESYIDLVIKVTGKDLFPPRPFAITTWNYPEAYGYSNEEVSAVWKAIIASRDFWRKLQPYDDAKSFLRQLWQRDQEVYFITSRVGDHVREQTEFWLKHMGFYHPTVLISSEKGECCHALKVDFYIDDKNENCVDVAMKSPITYGYMLARPWNAPQVAAGIDIPRIDNLDDFLKVI